MLSLGNDGTNIAPSSCTPPHLFLFFVPFSTRMRTEESRRKKGIAQIVKKGGMGAETIAK